MKFFRQHIIHRFFSIFMMLHILNLSVDAADVLPDAVPEDLSFNEIESVVEFILEDILHIDNALPEQDEQDETPELTKSSITFSTLPQAAVVSRSPQNADILIFAPCISSALQPTLDILSPPPKGV